MYYVSRTLAIFVSRWAFPTGGWRYDPSVRQEYLLPFPTLPFPLSAGFGLPSAVTTGPVRWPTLVFCSSGFFCSLPLLLEAWGWKQHPAVASLRALHCLLLVFLTLPNLSK